MVTCSSNNRFRLLEALAYNCKIIQKATIYRFILYNDMIILLYRHFAIVDNAGIHMYTYEVSY